MLRLQSRALTWFVSGTAQVASGFFLTDSLLALDRLLAGNFIVPPEDGPSSKACMAAADAKRLKKLLGSLRHLFRNSAVAKVLSVGFGFGGVLRGLP